MILYFVREAWWQTWWRRMGEDGCEGRKKRKNFFRRLVVSYHNKACVRLVVQHFTAMQLNNSNIMRMDL